MHEMGIVTHLAKTLDELAAEQKIVKIGKVTLQVGEVSGIMTDYFVDCWDYFKVRHTVLKDSTLELETLPAVTFCDNCKKNYETVKYGRTCPYCGSGETWLITGNECIIKQIEAETEDDRNGEKNVRTDEMR
jgi:hydrogenase nickel incorporation protein HypA/HybF